MSIEYPLASHFDVNTRALFELCPIATAKNWCKALCCEWQQDSNQTYDLRNPQIAMSVFQRVTISFCGPYFSPGHAFRIGVGEEGRRDK